MTPDELKAKAAEVLALAPAVTELKQLAEKNGFPGIAGFWANIETAQKKLANRDREIDNYFEPKKKASERKAK